MRACLLSRPEQFEYIRLAIPDTNASLGLAQQLGGLLQIVQPPDTFFFFNRNTSRIDMLLEPIGSKASHRVLG